MAGTDDRNSDDLENHDNYSPQTDKAKRISAILKESLYKTVRRTPRINFLVFGPGIGTQGYDSHRLPIKKMIEEKKYQNAEFPEDIKEDTLSGILDPNDPDYLGKFLKNTAAKEYIMAGAYDYIIIPLMSVGTFSEFSFFIRNDSIAQKIRLYVPSEHAESQGFLNTGPVKAFKDAYHSVKSFDDAPDLMVKVCEDIDNLIVMRLLQDKGF